MKTKQHPGILTYCFILSHLQGYDTMVGDRGAQVISQRILRKLVKIKAEDYN